MGTLDGETESIPALLVDRVEKRSPGPEGQTVTETKASALASWWSVAEEVMELRFAGVRPPQRQRKCRGPAADWEKIEEIGQNSQSQCAERKIHLKPSPLEQPGRSNRVVFD